MKRGSSLSNGSGGQLADSFDMACITQREREREGGGSK